MSTKSVSGVISDPNAEDSEKKFKKISFIDNVISEDHSDYLQMIFNDNFPWTAGATTYANDGFWTNHSMLYSKDPERPIVDPRHSYFLPILFNACKEYDYRIYEPLRIRCGLIYKDQGGDKHRPHVDLPDQPHHSLIYYVNDSDGPTNIFKNGKIVQKINPKKGRCFIMNGDTWHSSSCPKEHSHRIVVNINFVVKGYYYKDENGRPLHFE